MSEWLKKLWPFILKKTHEDYKWESRQAYRDLCNNIDHMHRSMNEYRALYREATAVIHYVNPIDMFSVKINMTASEDDLYGCIAVDIATVGYRMRWPTRFIRLEDELEYCCRIIEERIWDEVCPAVREQIRKALEEQSAQWTRKRGRP